ncbi:hypothetical protein ACIQRH_00920 [Pseudomonas sp. NPDC090964]|uniref:hypothetical protein n=1 Tax=unclassified Pseudomonas TaxID=196821 RepID=UPI000812B927|nr:hypothetical protein [Pseudomonas sp. 44 R 15]CRM32998.1 hypothetical protein [Pseudomonas sp. 44 R 15]
MSVCELIELPTWVVRASAVDWGVTVDGYLVNAARVGDRYAAIVYGDQSGVIRDGMTVVTPSVRAVEQRSGFTLVRSRSGDDHYVIVTELLDRDTGDA